MYVVENRFLVGRGSLLWGYLYYIILFFFGVRENFEMEVKNCGLVVNRFLFFSKGKASVGIIKKELVIRK